MGKGRALGARTFRAFCVGACNGLSQVFGWDTTEMGCGDLTTPWLGIKHATGGYIRYTPKGPGRNAVMWSRASLSHSAGRLRWGLAAGWALAALALTGLVASVSLRLCLHLGVGRGTLAPRRGPDGRRVQPSHTQGYNTPSLGFPFRVSVFRPPSSPSLFDFRSSTLRARARLCGHDCGPNECASAAL